MSESARWVRNDEHGWVSDEDDAPLATEARLLDEIETLQDVLRQLALDADSVFESAHPRRVSRLMKSTLEALGTLGLDPSVWGSSVAEISWRVKP